jgi:hypothetical protein
MHAAPERGFTAALLLLHCCFTADLLLLYCCCTAALLLIYCCFTAHKQPGALDDCEPLRCALADRRFFSFFSLPLLYSCFSPALLLLYCESLRCAPADCKFFFSTAALLLLYYCFLLLYCEPQRRALADCWSFLLFYYSSSLRPHTVVE